MKKRITIILFIIFAVFCPDVNAQSSWSTGADVVNTYVWRGSKAGSFSIQPTIKYTNGIFTVGAWGSGDLATGFPDEADLYTILAFKSGLSLGLTDYHYNISKYFANGAHAIEANLGYITGGLSLSGNYIFNSASGSLGDDKYFEVGFQFPAVKLFAGAGDGWYTTDGSFQVCDLGLSTTKSIKFSESFSLPFTGSVIFNPNREHVFYVVSMSF